MKLHKRVPMFLFLIAFGCGKKNPQALIEQWNANFQGKKSACENGDLLACREACKMSTQPAVCEAVRAVANMDNPEERDWVAQCAPNAARQAVSVCAAASALKTQRPPSAETPDDKLLSETDAAIDKLKQQQEAAVQQEDAMREALARAQAAAEDARRQAEAVANHSTDPLEKKQEPIQVIGALSQKDVIGVVGAKLNTIKKCYESRLTARPDLVGRMTVVFAISKTGSVQVATVRDSTLKDEPVERCVVSVLQRLVFPAPQDGGVVIVTFPLVFSAAD